MKKVAQMPLKLLVTLLWSLNRIFLYSSKYRPKMKQITQKEIGRITGMPPLTQIQRIDLSMDEAKEEVCQLLGWTDATYCEFQYVSGMEYLKAYYHNAPDIAWAAERSKLYWNWWKLNWLNRDQRYLSASTLQSMHIDMRRRFYLNEHDNYVLLEDIYPGPSVWEDCRRISKLNLYDKNRRYAQEDKKTA